MQDLIYRIKMGMTTITGRMGLFMTLHLRIPIWTQMLWQLLRDYTYESQLTDSTEDYTAGPLCQFR